MSPQVSWEMILLLAIPPTGQEDLLGEKLRLRGLTGCYALFQYVTMGVQAAHAVYNQARERMENLHHTLTSSRSSGMRTNEGANPASTDASQSAADSAANGNYVNRLASECEAIAVQQAALLRYHSSISVFPLATLRQMLTSALSKWPNSAPLWSIYVQVSPGPVIRYHYYTLILNQPLGVSSCYSWLTPPLDGFF